VNCSSNYVQRTFKVRSPNYGKITYANHTHVSLEK